MLVGIAAVADTAVTAGETAPDATGGHGPAAWTSTDGSTWEGGRLPGPHPEDTFVQGVAARPDRMVVVGYRGSWPEEAAWAWASVDGSTWKATQVAAAGNLSAVAAGPAGFVAVGFGPPGWPTVPTIWHSKDGLTWQRVGPNASGPYTGGFSGVTAGGPGFIAWGQLATTPVPEVTDQVLPQLRDAGLPWLSDDGVTWTRVDPSASLAFAHFDAVIVDGPRLLAFGRTFDQATGKASNRIWGSPDGKAWARVPADPRAVAHFGGSSAFTTNTARQIVGFGSDDQTVWTSPDAITWRQGEGPFPDQTSIHGVRAFDGRFVAIGQGRTEEPAVCRPIGIWLSPPG